MASTYKGTGPLFVSYCQHISNICLRIYMNMLVDYMHNRVRIVPTCWVSCLYHELLYNSMEDVSIVVAIASMDTEVLYSLGAAGERKSLSLSLSLFLSLSLSPQLQPFMLHVH